MPDTGGFRFVGERPRYTNNFFTVSTGTFVDPKGFTFERDYVRHPGAVVVVPLLADQVHVLMVRQYRASVDQVILELPAGKLDRQGEPLEAAARRELAEEVGRRAEVVTEVGWFYNSPGFTDERTVCFLAEDLTDVGRAHDGVEEEHMTIEAVPLNEVWKLAAGGDLIDAKTLLAIAFATRELAERDGGRPG